MDHTFINVSIFFFGRQRLQLKHSLKKNPLIFMFLFFMFLRGVGGDKCLVLQLDAWGLMTKFRRWFGRNNMIDFGEKKPHVHNFLCAFSAFRNVRFVLPTSLHILSLKAQFFCSWRGEKKIKASRSELR